MGDIVHLRFIANTGELRLRNEVVIETAVIKDNDAGSGYRVTIQDKRFGMVNRGAVIGQFNIPRRGVITDATGEPLLLTQEDLTNAKTIKELVQECINAMGDPTGSLAWNLDQLVADDGSELEIYPPTTWNFDDPGQACAKLLDDHGFTAALWPDSHNVHARHTHADEDLLGKMVVVKFGRAHPLQLDPNGTGFTVPRFFVVVPGTPPSVDPEPWESSEVRSRDPNLGATTVVVGSPLVREELVEDLIPVGLDLDGKVKPLRELSYFLDEGADWGGFSHITSGASLAFIDQTDRDNYAAGHAPHVPQGGTNYDVARRVTVRLPAKVPLDPLLGGPDEPIPPNAELYTIEEVRKAATASVWRWYQLPPEHLYKLPMLNHIVQTKEVGQGSGRRAVPQTPIVEVGEYVDAKGDANQGTTVAGNQDPSEWKGGGFQIDPSIGVVKFDRIVRRIATATLAIGETVPAKVNLRFAWRSKTLVIPSGAEADPSQWYGVTLQADSYHYPRYQNQTDFTCNPGDAGYPDCPAPADDPGSGAVDLSNAVILKRPDLVEYLIEDESQNAQELNDSALKLIRQHRFTAEAAISAPEGRAPFLVPYSCDGYIREMEWTFGGNGFQTLAVANRERAIVGEKRTLTYKEKTMEARDGQGAEVRGRRSRRARSRRRRGVGQRRARVARDGRVRAGRDAEQADRTGCRPGPSSARARSASFSRS